MQNKFSKKLGIIIIALLTISTISAAIPFASATITSRPTVYREDGTTDAPVTIEAGTNANIDTSGMSITGAQVWLWLSTTGGSEINTALGDRPYAGPFLLSELIDTVTPHTYTFTPAQIAALCNLLSVDSPFAGEGKTYAFTIGNYWINGTIPLKVQGEDVDYWIKIADVTPSDTIAGSEIGVSTNRVHFLPGFYATPLMGAPETEVTVSGYALPTTSEYNVTEDGTTVLGLLLPESHDEGGWLWTGFSNAFNVKDLGAKVPSTSTPSLFTQVNITVWENDTAALMDSWMFDQYWREVYLESEGTPLAFRGDTGDYTLTVTVNTGSEYDVDMEYFPAFGTASIYLGNVLCTSGIALNGTGGAKTSFTVPALTTGNYVFCVKDINAVMYNFTIHVVMVPYITCTPNTGYVGDTFVVTGVNFLDYVDDQITIYFENNDDSPYYVLMANFTCPSSTWTSTVLTVPNSMGGANLVEARNIDGTGVIAYTTYTVLAKLVVDPSVFSNNCSIVNVMGTGFEIWDDWTGYRKTYCINIDNQFMGAAASTTTNFGIVAANTTGNLNFQIVAGGFRPGRHVVALYGDARGSFVNGDIDTYAPAAYTCFMVTTEDDPIVAYLEQINGTIAMVGDLEVDLAEIHAAITSVSGDVATIKTDVGTMKTSLSSLSASISSVSSGMATLQTSIGSVQTSLASIDAVIGSMYGDLLTIDTTIGSFETSLDSIDATVSGLDSDVAALGSDMDSLIGDVASIDTVLGSVAGTVTSMEGTLATIETDLGTVKVDLASAKTKIAAVETDVNDNLPVDMMPVWIAVILSLIAAIGAIAGVFIIQRKIA